MKEEHPKTLRKFCSRIRKIVETVGSHLTERFAIASIRVHDIWHFQHRIIRKVLVHTVMVFLNLQLHFNKHASPHAQPVAALTTDSILLKAEALR